MSTGIGAPIPGPYLLASVAAVVLGGVALGGGRGGLVGPIVAVFVLRLVRTDLTLLAVDPNVTTIIEGAIMVVVVMFGAFIAMRGPLAMSESATAPQPASPRPPHQAVHGRPAAGAADHPAGRPGGGPADPASRHRQRALDRQHRQVRHPAGNSRRLPDHDHADRRHRPFGRHRRDDERLHHGDAGRQPRPGGGDPDRLGAGRADRPGQRHRRRRLSRASADHDARHQPRSARAACRSTSAPSSPRAPRSRPSWPGSAPASPMAFPTRCCCSCRSRPHHLHLRRTGFGRLLYAVGDNEKATRLSGVLLLAGDHRALRHLRRCSPASPGFSISA